MILLMILYSFILDGMGLRQLIKDSKRITIHSSTLIDLRLTDDTSLVPRSSVTNLYDISYYMPISIIVNFGLRILDLLSINLVIYLFL